MHVLSSDRGELHYFPTPENVPGGYAILSHVWDKHEETFKDVQKIAKWCKENDTNPRDFVSPKIRNCCILAEKHGYKWIWDDTCCIDKRSSTDLSEAINSMFRYYSLARVCYAYLADVPSDDDPHVDDSAFRYSRWHSRGWTLQELIAPKFLIFISNDWTILDGRTELADVVEEITNIPIPLLRLETMVSDYSVAQRMSWAALRETTREEDRAYSLMGIFDIHMPTLYGEGSKAFRRLQEEILRQSVDPSLLLWGYIDKLERWATEDPIPSCDHNDSNSCLLASSPYAFSDSSGVTFSATDVRVPPIEKSELTQHKANAPENYETILSEHLPTFTLTPYGVHAHLHVVQGANGRLLAILPCFEGEECLILPLYPCSRPSDPSRPLYHTGFLDSRVRMAVINSDGLRSLCVRDGSVVVEWKEVYIPLWPQQQARNAMPTIPINTMLSPPFRISELSTDSIYRAGYHMHSASPTSATWTGAPHISVVFRRQGTEAMEILLGRCESDASETTGSREPGQLGPHWAVIRFNASEDDTSGREFAGHVCRDDHIDLWPDGDKCVNDPHLTAIRFSYNWRLSFTPCRIHPTITLIANLERTTPHQPLSRPFSIY